LVRVFSNCAGRDAVATECRHTLTAATTLVKNQAQKPIAVKDLHSKSQ
jgi:hypothetical protein